MRSPLASATCGALLLAGAAWLGPIPPAHAEALLVSAPAVSVTACADAKLRLAAVEDDLNTALKAADGLTTTADELVRRLGLGTLLGTAKTENDDAVVKIRAVLTLRANRVLAEDRVNALCTEPVTSAPSSPSSSSSGASSSSSSSASPNSGYQVPRRPKRAPETGGGPHQRQPAGAEDLGDVTTRSIAPAMALYALLGVGSSAAVYSARVWLARG